jgi:hypothetical protein
MVAMTTRTYSFARFALLSAVLAACSGAGNGDPAQGSVESPVSGGGGGGSGGRGGQNNSATVPLGGRCDRPSDTCDPGLGCISSTGEGVVPPFVCANVTGLFVACGGPQHTGCNPGLVCHFECPNGCPTAFADGMSGVCESPVRPGYPDGFCGGEQDIQCSVPGTFCDVSRLPPINGIAAGICSF